MPPRQGTYWVVKPKSQVRHIQAYREMTFVLCGVGTSGTARQVFVGSEPDVEEMELCRHCEREARRIVKALEDAGVAADA